MRRQGMAHLILDGYNVIHAWSHLTSLAKFELAVARDKLIDCMQEYATQELFMVTIVFDAIYTPEEFHQEDYGKLVTVCFTSQGETADSYIERLTYELVQSNHEVYVVTSDAPEQSYILGAGAYRLPSKELERRVFHTKKNLRKNFLEEKSKQPRNQLSDKLDETVLKQLDAWRKKK